MDDKGALDEHGKEQSTIGVDSAQEKVNFAIDKSNSTLKGCVKPKINAFEHVEFKKPVFQTPASEAINVNKQTANVVSTNNEVQSETDNASSKTSSQSNLSPAEQLKQKQIAIPYKEPQWSGMPEDQFAFEVLKNGVIIDTLKLDKPFYVFGRLPSCDITLEHPSLSRYHAVVQYCKVPQDGKEKGWYLYDLDSTHGTWINKYKTYANKYYRLHVGHVIKFGGSTRLHILQVILKTRWGYHTTL